MAMACLAIMRAMFMCMCRSRHSGGDSGEVILFERENKQRRLVGFLGMTPATEPVQKKKKHIPPPLCPSSLNHALSQLHPQGSPSVHTRSNCARLSHVTARPSKAAALAPKIPSAACAVSAATAPAAVHVGHELRPIRSDGYR